MILISHRGNVNGKQHDKENHPNYIDNALNLGYDVEIDVWVIEGTYYLGHDEPQYIITQHWLNERKNKLWIHCKNLEAIEWFFLIKGFNYFWHETDTITLTSQKYIWAHPGKQPIKNSIAVMPEIYQDNLDVCKGICTDNINKYKNGYKNG